LTALIITYQNYKHNVCYIVLKTQSSTAVLAYHPPSSLDEKIRKFDVEVKRQK